MRCAAARSPSIIPIAPGRSILLLPLNTQPARLTLNLAALPERPKLPALAPADDARIDAGRAELIAAARKRRHQGRRRHARP